MLLKFLQAGSMKFKIEKRRTADASALHGLN